MVYRNWIGMDKGRTAEEADHSPAYPLQWNLTKNCEGRSDRGRRRDHNTTVTEESRRTSLHQNTPHHSQRPDSNRVMTILKYNLTPRKQSVHTNVHAENYDQCKMNIIHLYTSNIPEKS